MMLKDPEMKCNQNSNIKEVAKGELMPYQDFGI